MRSLRLQKESLTIPPQNPVEQCLWQGKLSESMDGLCLIVPRGIRAKEEIVRRMFAEHPHGLLRGKIGEGKGDFHKNFLTKKHGLNLFPDVPAPKMGSDQAEVRESFSYCQDLGRIGPASAREGDIIAAMDNQEESGLAQGLVERGEPFFVEEKILIIGVHLDADKAFLFQPEDLGCALGVGGMDRGQRDKTGRSDTMRPGKNGLKLGGSGGDGADDADVNASPVHRGQQGINSSRCMGRDIAFFCEGGNSLGGDGIGKGVGVKIDNHGALYRRLLLSSL